jgi:LAO/AO transport system kinase
LIDANETAQRVRNRARTRARTLSRQEYVNGILQGDSIILAQAITLIESTRATDRDLAELILEDCLPGTGKSIRVGISGVPGAGKSTVIEALGKHLIGKLGQKVAVLAVDPSSQLSGGSILGDKTRMPWLASSELAFIRPSPSRGSFGGIAQHTREAMLLCEAAGFRNIIIETVGVGQSETAVHEMVDFFVLITLAGAGDELQGIKRGAMELADLVVINKADGPNLAAAERARAEAQNALHFFPASATGWTPCAITCSALTGDGIDTLWNCALQHAQITRANGWLALTRQDQQRHWLQEILSQGLRQLFDAHPTVERRIGSLEQEVLAGQISPFRAARTLLDAYSGAAPKQIP